MRPFLPSSPFILSGPVVKYHNPVIVRCHENVLFCKKGLLSGVLRLGIRWNGQSSCRNRDREHGSGKAEYSRHYEHSGCLG